MLVNVTHIWTLGKPYVDASSGHESNTALRVDRLVLAEELEFVILVLKVSNVAVTTLS
jgi:hypothetical protein